MPIVKIQFFPVFQGDILTAYQRKKEKGIEIAPRFNPDEFASIERRKSKRENYIWTKSLFESHRGLADPMPGRHTPLEYKKIEEVQKYVSQLLQTDRDFHKLVRDRSFEEEVLNRWQKRF